MRTAPAVGRTAVAAGIVGAAMGLSLAFMTPEVASDRWSYPQTPTHFLWTQLGFVVQHVACLIALLAATSAVGRSMIGRTGWYVGIGGMVLLTVNEGLAVLARHQAADSRLAGALEAIYGTGTLVIAVGLMVGGTAAVRAGVWTKPESWLLFLLGGWLVVPTLPVLLLWPAAPSRIVLSVWVLLFAVLGWVLLRRSAKEAPSGGLLRAAIEAPDRPQSSSTRTVAAPDSCAPSD